MDGSDGICLSQKLSQVRLGTPVLPEEMEVGIASQESGGHTYDKLYNYSIPDIGQDDFCSQDFFCTPDYITPKEAQFRAYLDGENKENDDDGQTSPMVDMTPVRVKRPRAAMTPVEASQDSFGSQALQDCQDGRVSLQDQDSPAPLISLADASESETSARPLVFSITGVRERIRPSARKQVGPRQHVPPNPKARLQAMRRAVLSPPCFKNPFLLQSNEEGDCGTASGRRRSLPFGGPTKSASGTCLSRYREDFHELAEIGHGNFSRVHKAQKRIDGCLYAVKRSRKQLYQDSEKKKALTEVQAMAASGTHENIVRYYNAWWENDYLYIQMELCEGSLSGRIKENPNFSEVAIVDILQQVGRALAHMHAQGLAHLDVKPDNIYILNNTFKLGDFGRATRCNGSMSVEEGDSRYMPLELLNDDYSDLTKADMFSLGATAYELAKRSELPSQGNKYQDIRQGKLQLLVGFSISFQQLLKALMHPDPTSRPSAEDLLRHHILSKRSTPAPVEAG